MLAIDYITRQYLAFIARASPHQRKSMDERQRDTVSGLDWLHLAHPGAGRAPGSLLQAGNQFTPESAIKATGANVLRIENTV
ncbi:hypothetical protein [Janthinobacterium sp.]|uniref:hypothetical protein n=1 Tax=Janthinobacterium sp. TaxID=1871054 RepID=UPI0028A257E9|nr:hypothetical protein [Janthinobacterium sp.]